MNNFSLKVAGLDSREYIFDVNKVRASLNHGGGVYIFVFYDYFDSDWKIVYVGQTENFRDRVCKGLKRHHKWQDIKQSGATHVGLLNIENRRLRLKVEEELISSQNPPCNKEFDVLTHLKEGDS